MNKSAIQAAAKKFEKLTGFSPQNFDRCAGDARDCANALKADIEWYRVHTDEMHQMSERALRAATQDR